MQKRFGCGRNRGENVKKRMLRYSLSDGEADGKSEKNNNDNNNQILTVF